MLPSDINSVTKVKSSLARVHMKVRKAVIPAAGLGTRFLPVTKTIPKEMLPIIDTPTILFLADEIVRAGIEDIIIVAGRHKSAIEDFFDLNYELEDTLIKHGKDSLLKKVDYIKRMANVISIRQKQPLGLGHAVLTSAPIVGNEPFAVLLGDEVMISSPDDPTVTQQLCSLYQQESCSAVAIMEVEKSEVNKYGIIDGKKEKDHIRVSSVVEKPDIDKAPSQWALPGRYVFDHKIFSYLKDTKPGKNGEIQLTDAMTTLAQKDGLVATKFLARRYDAGDKFGFVQANIELGLEHPEVGAKLKSYLKTLAKNL